MPIASDESFADHRKVAIVLLLKHKNLTRKAAQFLGQIVGYESSLTERQRAWLENLLDAANLHQLREGE